MYDTLPALVSHSLLFTFAFSLLLLVFIILRRLVVTRREAHFQARYLRIEQAVLQAISAKDAGPAVEVARKYASQRKVLTQVLIDFLEIISGRGQEILKVIFEHGLKERCLKDLRSRLVVRRLRATRLVGLFSVLPDKALLLDLLRDKPIIRLAAVNAMVRFPDRESLALVFQAFEQESCPSIHTYANIIFGAGERVEPFIKACLTKNVPSEKLSLLIELAGSIPLPSLYPEVVRHAAHPEKEVRIKVVKALGKFLVPESFEILENMAGDPEWEVQAQVLRALGNLKNAGALVILTRGLFSPSWYVRYNAREGLLNLGALGIRRLEEISSQEVDRFAADMATMALEEISYSGVW
jgi:hypothetical protein